MIGSFLSAALFGLAAGAALVAISRVLALLGYRGGPGGS